MSPLLALIAAMSFGVADFIAALAARRSDAYRVSFLSLAVAAVAAIGVVLVARAGAPTTSELEWGTISGVASGIGTFALYQGLARGSMSVVAPISAVFTALLPAAFSWLRGDYLSPVTLSGIVLAIPAVVLVATEPRLPGEKFSWDTKDVVYGLVAGAGVAGYAIAASVPEQGDYWVSVLSLGVAALLVGCLALVRTRGLIPRRALSMTTGAGVLIACGSVTFRLASLVGPLATAAVLMAMYPVATVALAAIVLKEPIGRLRYVGLSIAIAAVMLIVLG